MSEIKWIKITTTMFEDDKIEFIESLPEADAILIIWIKLLTLAGKCNMNGYIFLTEKIPYTEEMLAHKFRRPLNTVKLALETFKKLGMIEEDHGAIMISNWEKHQNVDVLEKIREDTRLRVQRYRERQKALRECNVTDTLPTTLQSRNGNDIRSKKKEVRNKNKDLSNIYIPYREIIEHLNAVTGSSYRHTSQKTQKLIKARWNEGFTLNDFKTVIDKKAREWLNNPEMSKYLRPETLFGTKFEAYLNQIERRTGHAVDQRGTGETESDGGTSEINGYYEQFGFIKSV
jgi:predicted phage replisome organizer/uncharacterized phage protein (TIGR02220 family)